MAGTDDGWTPEQQAAAWDRPPSRTGGELWAIGADGAPGGWLAALGYGKDTELHRVEVVLVESFEALVALRGEGDVPVCVDVPMGLPDTPSYRACDREARDLLEERRGTVFAPPARSILDTDSYAAARAILDRAKTSDPSAKSMSAQSYGIVPKVREADQFLQAHPDAVSWLREVHPEVSFVMLNRQEALQGKRSPGGSAQRLRLLDPHFPGMLEALGRMRVTGRQADMTDALDALAALHSALQVRAGVHDELGDGSLDSTGLPMRMVC